MRADLADTTVHRNIGIAPYGFFYTENLAEWIDRLAAQEPPEPEPEPVVPEPNDKANDEEGEEGRRRGY